MTTTAWGKATVIEEVTVKQVASGKPFATLVQLLEGEEGERLVRFAYSTDGTARRGPVTLRGNDLERLKKSLVKAPRLKEALCSGLR
jgi:hypothetical protein